MNEFAQAFADITTKMRAANIAKDIALTLYDKLTADRKTLMMRVEEFVSGVYDVEQGHVVVENRGNISFYEKDCDD